MAWVSNPEYSDQEIIASRFRREQEQREREEKVRREAITDRKQIEANLRSLSPEDKLALKHAGYKGNLDPLPPGEGSGQLVMTKYRNEAGHTFREYEGDPASWMVSYMSPVKHLATFFRHETESDLDFIHKGQDFQNDMARKGLL